MLTTRNNPAYLAVDIIQDKDKNGKKDPTDYP